MEMLTIVTWIWGNKYDRSYIEKLARGVQKNLSIPFRFRVFTPQSEDIYLSKIKGCFPRLRMFDEEWQHDNHIRGRVVCMDLDSVVVGRLDPLFEIDDDFAILQGANASNPCPYNGSIWTFRAGYRPDVWSEFSLEAAKNVPYHEFPDDQAWLAHKLPGAAKWKVGPGSGVYALGKPAWKSNFEDLPKDARLVVFPGWRDPSKFTHLPWVRENWK